MNDELLDSLKKDLELDLCCQTGRFGIYDDHVDREDIYFIKANKEGLKLFAYQLLCAAKDFEQQEQEQVFQKIALEDGAWLYKNCDIVLRHIEDPSMIKVRETEIVVEPSWKDKVFEIAGVILVIFLLISLIVGVYTVIDSIL